jgi:hypothetical protein
MFRPSGWALLVALVLAPWSAWAQEDPKTDPSVVALEEVLEAGSRDTLTYYRRILEAFAQGRNAAAAEGRNWLLMPFAPYGPITRQNEAKVRELQALFEDKGDTEDAQLGGDVLEVLHDLHAARTPLLATVLSGLVVEQYATLRVHHDRNQTMLEIDRESVRTYLRAVRSAMDESSPLIRDARPQDVKALAVAVRKIRAAMLTAPTESYMSLAKWESSLAAIELARAEGFMDTLKPALSAAYEAAKRARLDSEDKDAWRHAEDMRSQVLARLPLRRVNAASGEPVSQITQLVKRGNLVLLPTLAKIGHGEIAASFLARVAPLGEIFAYDKFLAMMPDQFHYHDVGHAREWSDRVRSTIEDFLSGKASLAFETLARFMERIGRDVLLEDAFYDRFHELPRLDPFAARPLGWHEETMYPRAANAFNADLEAARATLESSARSEGMLPSLEDRVANEATTADLEGEGGP